MFLSHKTLMYFKLKCHAQSCTFITFLLSKNIFVNEKKLQYLHNKNIINRNRTKTASTNINILQVFTVKMVLFMYIMLYSTLHGT